MNEIKLLHAADLHLDSPFEGLGGEKAMRRRAEQRQLLYGIAQLAERESADMILLAGDLLDSDTAYAETAEDIAKAFGSLGIPVFISPGNHDFYSERSPYARVEFPENIHIFKKPVPECVELPDIGARVWGAAFTDKHSGAMLRGFSAAKLPGVKDIMCIHGELNEASSYDPITESDIAASGMDYIALGHIHSGSGLRRAGGCCYAWPGCPEGRGFDETGDKQVYIVTLGESCDIKSVSIAKRRYEIAQVQLSGGDVLGDIEKALPQNTENDIYRIILRGESERSPDVDALLRALEGRFFALQLRDETVLRRDVWALAGDDSLRGRFIMRLKQEYDAAKTDAEREKISQAVRWGLAALDNREEVVRHGN